MLLMENQKTEISDSFNTPIRRVILQKRTLGILKELCEKYPTFEPHDLVHKALHLGLHTINSIGFDEANRLIKEKYDHKKD